MAERVREEGRSASPARRMALRSALRLAGSSPAALAGTAGKLGWDDLEPQVAGASTSAKGAALLGVLGRMPEGEKAIVFTAFRRNQEGVARQLVAGGV